MNGIRERFECRLSIPLRLNFTWNSLFSRVTTLDHIDLSSRVYHAHYKTGILRFCCLITRNCVISVQVAWAGWTGKNGAEVYHNCITNGLKTGIIWSQALNPLIYRVNGNWTFIQFKCTMGVIFLTT